MVQYCDVKGKEIDDVAGNDREWDRFEVWSKGKQRGLGTRSKKFNDWQKASRMGDEEDGGKKEHPTRFYDRPSPSDIYSEGSGQVDEFTITNFIGEELMECEWVDQEEVKFSGDEPWVEIATPDGDVFKVQVTKVYSGKLGSWLDER